jgi:[acyl-carrier-protein] S-malonyltransferase
MADALTGVRMLEPAVPLIANVTARPVSDAREIKIHLVEQVTGMVKWRESVAAMVAAGVNTFCELGAGKVLTGLARRNAPQAKSIAMGTPEEIAAALTVLRGEAYV